MRVALFGLGAAGASHLEVLDAMPEAEIYGLCDLNPARLELFAPRFPQAKITGRPDELLQDPAVDVVSVVAAPAAHHPLVTAAAAAGKHVICEKPIATEVDHGRAMVEAMDRSGKLFCITFNHRAGTVTRRIREVVRQGLIGHVRMIRLIGQMAQPDDRHLRERVGPDAAIARTKGICIDGKNALFDCGVHTFDYARYLVGSEYKRIKAMGWSMRGFPHPDHGVALCEHENGVFSLIEKSFVYAYEAQTRKEYVRYEVLGDQGSLAWDLDTQRLRVFGPSVTIDEPLSHDGKTSVRELIYRGFFESIAAGRLQDWLASGLDGLRAIEAAQAALDDMLTNGVVERTDVGRAANWFDGVPGMAGRLGI